MRHSAQTLSAHHNQTCSTRSTSSTKPVSCILLVSPVVSKDLSSAGKQIAIRNTATGEISFLQIRDNVACVTQLTLSENRSTLFVSELLQDHPNESFVSMYDLRSEQPKIIKSNINVTELVNSNNFSICTLNTHTGQLSIQTKIPSAEANHSESLKKDRDLTKDSL